MSALVAWEEPSTPFSRVTRTISRGFRCWEVLGQVGLWGNPAWFQHRAVFAVLGAS